MNRSQNSPTAAGKRGRAPAAEKRRAAASMPAFIAPQLATLVAAVPGDSGWAYELKFDGYRLFCRIDHGRVTVLTRNAQDWTARFAVLAEAAKQLPARQGVIDGEIVALDDEGAQDFQRLQNSFHGDPARLVYYAFDLLYFDGRDLRASPLLERKKVLQRFIARGAKGRNRLIRYSEHWTGHGKELFAEACNAGLEGIVAKRANDPYRSGRTRSWLKVKCSQSQEFVIGGFTDPAGARAGFGALLLGVHDKGGALRYAGRVGTGFNQSALRDLHLRLKKHQRRSTPFAGAPRSAGSGGVHWVEPRLVAEVVFTGWTSDGMLRHPSFKGLREDKPAREIIREMAAPIPPSGK
jgi:bifunctional non-homologous end joining protein LigD